MPQAYQALYRKWRPMTFADVLSQPQVTTTLQNQLRAGTTAHAYLFTGSRGTGKTTCARILAKAVNCEHPRPDGNPCLECQTCRDAEAGALSDIIEIDAASNNSVEDIRDLRDGAVYTPERCRFKIYIIDEVHMLSVSAFNALLKIMEEPPEYVKFILATTEIHKVPATIISRCQRYDFRRIRQEDLVTRLLYIAEQEQIRVERDAAELMAKLSDGGMRDAISLLDRCAALGDVITAPMTAEAAGAAGREYLLQMLEAIRKRDAAQTLAIIAQLHEASKDLGRLCEELILMLRDVMLLKTTGDTALLQCMADEIPTLQSIAQEADLAQIMAVLDTFQTCRERMGRAVNRRVELEMTCIRVCSGQTAPAGAAVSANTAELRVLEDRIAQLESRPMGGGASGMTPDQKRAQELMQPHKSPAPEPEPEADLKKLRLSDFTPVAQWGDILEECGRLAPAVVGTLANSEAKSYANILLVIADNPFFLDMFKLKENAAALSEAVFRVLGRRFVIRAKCSQAATQQRPLEEMLERARNSGIKTTAVE
ncbi:MAG: DNA polymerase III subunit gamma/tau [Oscillospiraceae bacterium]|nr:DNA polymerase III subunit gamma/tau [Oscillospiraceae bacterium]